MAVTTANVSLMPTEVELALEVMPCQADRRVYEPADSPHPCTYFAKWGVYHSFDYGTAGPPPDPGIRQPSIYRGKTSLIPEILSGCRKAPLMAVGINPNLPGWWPATHNALNPLLDDFLQYAHYFRYRSIRKLAIPQANYKKLLEQRVDSPQTTAPLTTVGSEIPTELVPLTMYEAYQGLLDTLAQRQGWSPHTLTVGEDLSYGNMVACPSAKWLTDADPKNPDMPVMTKPIVDGIVGECFHKRQYFLRQLFQSLPAVLLVFSETTADAFIASMQSHFIAGSPRPGESIPALLGRKIAMRYGQVGGRDLTVRVIFTPHASADPAAFAAAREKVIAALIDEAQQGHIVFNPNNGHLGRPPGSCVFCANSLYQIGRCDYENEIRPLGGEPPAPTAEVRMSPDHVMREKGVQQQLLRSFLERTREASAPAHRAGDDRANGAHEGRAAPTSATQAAFTTRG